MQAAALSEKQIWLHAMRKKVPLPTHNQLNTRLQLVFIVYWGRHLLCTEASSKFQTRLPFKSRVQTPGDLLDVTQSLSRNVLPLSPSFQHRGTSYTTLLSLWDKRQQLPHEGQNPSCLNNSQTCGRTRAHTHSSYSVGVWWLCWVRR